VVVVLEDRSLERQPAARVPLEKQRLLWALTPSEREVALLICEGCSNAEVARRLKKSPLTTKKQLTSIFSKLNVRTRGRLMALMRCGGARGALGARGLEGGSETLPYFFKGTSGRR
jgi:DNA-binding CsgD family transcriptional regulator